MMILGLLGGTAALKEEYAIIALIVLLILALVLTAPAWFK